MLLHKRLPPIGRVLGLQSVSSLQILKLTTTIQVQKQVQLVIRRL